MLTGRSVYGAAKRLGEELVLAARKRGTDALSVRLFNVYGQGMDPTMGAYARVIPNFHSAGLTPEVTRHDARTLPERRLHLRHRPPGRAVGAGETHRHQPLG